MNYMTVSDKYIEKCEEYAKQRALIDLDRCDAELINRFIEIFNDVLFGNKSMGENK